MGRKLRERRQERGLTLGALAAETDVAVGYISMIERGKLKRPPSAKVLDRLCDTLGLDAGEMARLAAWARADRPVRDAASDAAAQAERGKELAEWLKGRGLDEALKSGELERRVAAVLGEGGSTKGEVRSEQAEPLAVVQIPIINKVAAGYPTGFTDLDYPARVADDYTAAPGMNDPDAFAAVVCGHSMQPLYREGDVVIFSPAAIIEDGCDCFARLEPDHETMFKRLRILDEHTYELVPLNKRFKTRLVSRLAVAGLYRAVLVQRKV